MMMGMMGREVVGEEEVFPTVLRRQVVGEEEVVPTVLRPPKEEAVRTVL
jgi:hypothetical protein